MKIKGIIGSALTCLLVLSCGTLHSKPIKKTSENTTTTASQHIIDKAVERVSKENEAYRKLAAEGCPRERMRLVFPFVQDGKQFYIYECRLYSGKLVRYIKHDDTWTIIGEDY